MQDFAHDSIWMRRLARSLVGDHVADDVVQEAWLKVRNKGDIGGGYLSQVVRSVALHWRRSEGRRSSREANSSRPEALPSTDEVAARIEVAERLSRALNELDEPYKTTLVLHFFDGLTSAEIARRAEIPAGTVRARLKRGLDTLRARLDQGSDGRSSWLAVLLPLARMPLEPSRSLTSVASVSVLAKVVIAIAFVAVGGIFIRSLRSGNAPGSTSLAIRPTDQEANRPRDSRNTPSANGSTQTVAGQRTATAASVASQPSSAGEGTNGTPIRARVVDENGSPLARAWLRIALLPDFSASADSDGLIAESVDGSLEHLATKNRLALWVGAPGHRTRHLEWPFKNSELQLGDVVLEPGGSLLGRVVDEAGLGIEGAVVAFGRPVEDGADATWARRGPSDLNPGGHSSSSPAIVSSTGPGGSFQIDGLPVGYGSAWARTRTSVWTCSKPVAIVAGAQTDGLVLVVTAAPDEVISGRVVDPAGESVPGLEMRFTRSGDASGWWTRRTDALGNFHFVPTKDTPQDIDLRSPSWEWEHAKVEGVEPGTHDLTIAFERSSWVEVAVQDERGMPVRGGRVSAVPATGPTDRAHDRGDSTLNESGLGRLRRTDSAFRVLTEIPGYRNELAGPFEPDVQDTLTITVEALPALVGTVLRPDGTAAAGARVSLHRGRTERSGNLAPGQARSQSPGGLTHQGWPGDRDAFVYDLFVEPTISVEADAEGRYRLPLPGVDPSAVDEARTPTQGFGGLGYAGGESARLKTPKPEQPWFLHAALAGQATLTDGPHWFESPEQTRIDLELPPGGEVEGLLALDDETSPLGWTVRASDGLVGLVEADVASDGTFRLTDLHAGDWQVRAFEPGRAYRHGGRMLTERRPEPDVTVIAGRTIEYRHETRTRRSARLVGELLVDGEPPGAWIVGVRTSTPQAAITSYDTTLDVDGRFHVTMEPELKTTITILKPGGGGLAVIAHPTIVAGRNEWSFHIETASVEGTIDPAQLPESAFQQITYVVEDGVNTIRTIVEPDAEGKVEPTMVATGHGRLYCPQHNFRQPPVIWAELDLEPGQTKSFRVP